MSFSFGKILYPSKSDAEVCVYSLSFSLQNPFTKQKKSAKEKNAGVRAELSNMLALATCGYFNLKASSINHISSAQRPHWLEATTLNRAEYRAFPSSQEVLLDNSAVKSKIPLP